MGTKLCIQWHLLLFRTIVKPNSNCCCHYINKQTVHLVLLAFSKPLACTVKSSLWRWRSVPTKLHHQHMPDNQCISHFWCQLIYSKARLYVCMQNNKWTWNFSMLDTIMNRKFMQVSTIAKNCRLYDECTNLIPTITNMISWQWVFE